MTDIAKTEVQEFADLFWGSFEMLKRACRIYADAIAADPGKKADFRARLPELPEKAWGDIERVGRGDWDVRLLWGGGNAKYRIRRLPASTQAEVIDAGVEVLTNDGSPLKVKVEALTQFQIEQVFADDHIRGLPEQRAWVESRKLDCGKVPDAVEAYRITAGKLTVIRPQVFTKAQLARFIELMG